MATRQVLAGVRVYSTKRAPYDGDKIATQFVQKPRWDHDPFGSACGTWIEKSRDKNTYHVKKKPTVETVHITHKKC